MRYNTWNMGSSAPAGGKKMEMVDSVAGVPKVCLAADKKSIALYAD